MSKGTVIIKSTIKGAGDSGLVKVTSTYPSGKEFSKWVPFNDDHDEINRQANFAEERGFLVQVNPDSAIGY